MVNVFKGKVNLMAKTGTRNPIIIPLPCVLKGEKIIKKHRKK